MSKVRERFDDKFIQEDRINELNQSKTVVELDVLVHDAKCVDDFEMLLNHGYVKDPRFGSNIMLPEEIIEDFKKHGNLSISKAVVGRSYLVDPNILGDNIITKQRLYELTQNTKALKIFFAVRYGWPDFLRFAFECIPPMPIESLIEMALNNEAKMQGLYKVLSLATDKNSPISIKKFSELYDVAPGSWSFIIRFAFAYHPVMSIEYLIAHTSQNATKMQELAKVLDLIADKTNLIALNKFSELYDLAPCMFDTHVRIIRCRPSFKYPDDIDFFINTLKEEKEWQKQMIFDEELHNRLLLTTADQKLDLEKIVDKNTYEKCQNAELIANTMCTILGQIDDV
jgi:hypothetical protein